MYHFVIVCIHSPLLKIEIINKIKIESKRFEDQLYELRKDHLESETKEVEAMKNKLLDIEESNNIKRQKVVC